MFKRSVVDRFGGLAALGCYIAEDYFLGLHVRQEGYQALVSRLPGMQNSAPGSLNSFRERILR